MDKVKMNFLCEIEYMSGTLFETILEKKYIGGGYIQENENNICSENEISKYYGIK